MNRNNNYLWSEWCQCFPQRFLDSTFAVLNVGIKDHFGLESNFLPLLSLQFRMAICHGELNLNKYDKILFFFIVVHKLPAVGKASSMRSCQNPLHWTRIDGVGAAEAGVPERMLLPKISYQFCQFQGLLGQEGSLWFRPVWQESPCQRVLLDMREVLPQPLGMLALLFQ